jgi:alkaline phosphatase
MKKTTLLSILLMASMVCTTVNAVQVKQKKNNRPKNIILLIGDGMGLAQICAGYVANGGYLHFDRFKHIGLSKTNSADDYITDSAAGATAISTGKKTYNKAIGVDQDSIPAKTILEYAEENGWATGMVVTCPVTHATPASFIAHQPSRSMDEAIAADFLKTDIDVFIGGGQTFFDKRADGKNLLNDLRANGYQVATDLKTIYAITEGKLAGFMAEKDPLPAHKGRDSSFLANASLHAIRLLQKNKQGFFLMIEGSQIDWGGHSNDIDYINAEMLDFNRVLGAILDFAEKDGNTLVIVTADHETGGLSLNQGTSYRKKHVEAAFTTKGHTGIMVPVFAFGPGAEQFQGIYPNTELFHKMMNYYGFRR